MTAPSSAFGTFSPHVFAWGEKDLGFKHFAKLAIEALLPRASGGEEPALSDDERSEEESKGGRRPDEGG